MQEPEDEDLNESGDDSGDESEGEILDGVAFFPEIPADLNIHPLWLATVHAIVFIAGSGEQIVHPGAAEEALQTIAEYLQRIEGDNLRRIQEDMECLIGYARQEKWPKGFIQSLKTFLEDLGIEANEA